MAMAMDEGKAGKVVITGACGFLGNLLAAHLAPHHADSLILLDHAPPPPHPVAGAHYVRSVCSRPSSLSFSIMPFASIPQFYSSLQSRSIPVD